MNIGQQVLGNLSPVVVGAIATWAGGVEGWRWAFFVLGIPGAFLAIAVFFLHEPPRGQYEKDDVLGEVVEDENPAQPSMEAAFARLKKIATIRTSIAAFAALGFGVFALGALQVLYLNDTLHVTEHPATAASSSASPGWTAVPFLYPVGRYFDRTYRKNPAKALVLVGLLILPSALFTPLQFSTHSIAWFVIWGIPQAVLTACAFAMVTPVLQAVCPYRLRGLGVAMGVMYVVLIGGFGGSILADFFTNAFGVRTTVFILLVPTSIVGGAAAHQRRALHPPRPVARRRGAARGAGGAAQARDRRRADPGAPGREHRLLLRARAGAVRRQLRDLPGRVRRAARHERRGQVDDPARASAGSRYPNAA